MSKIRGYHPVKQFQKLSALNSATQVLNLLPFSHAVATTFKMDHLRHTCGLDAEPLHRYRLGGYHPIFLGDLFKDGRYEVMHKLGWEGYSAVWAAKDLR
jgi:serine/threonine-protein kinase SRPK3